MLLENEGREKNLVGWTHLDDVYYNLIKFGHFWFCQPDMVRMAGQSTYFKIVRKCKNIR